MESDISTCRACGLQKPRILLGKFNHKDKKFVDETGKLWNGRVCSTCHKAKLKARYHEDKTDVRDNATE